jgi:hypothetical protein
MEASAAATLARHARRSDPSPRYHGRTRATTCSRRHKRLPFTQEIAGSSPAGGMQLFLTDPGRPLVADLVVLLAANSIVSAPS